jgi:hypothetical protein
VGDGDSVIKRDAGAFFAEEIGDRGLFGFEGENGLGGSADAGRGKPAEESDVGGARRVGIGLVRDALAEIESVRNEEVEESEI